jgi:uncharacterized protein YndB with AHSA1/START domain
VPARPRETEVVEHEISVAARAETVFAYFTDPTRMAAWMGRAATLDPRPGGICRIEINDATVMLGRFEIVEPFSRVSFTWGWEHDLFEVPPQSTAVDVSLTPHGNGTIVHIAHRKLAPDAIPAHRTGWAHYVPRLAVAATGADPGPDPWMDVTVAARALGLLA